MDIPYLGLSDSVSAGVRSSQNSPNAPAAGELAYGRGRAQGWQVYATRWY